MKILVTGGLGFVGTNLTKELLNQGHQVTVIDNLSAGILDNKVEGANYIIKSTSEIDSDFEKVDLVFHLGEYSKIAPSFNEIDNVFNLNIVGSFSVLEYCRHNNIPLVYAASSTRLASEGESHSPYAFFKSTITNLVKNYGKWYNLKYSICYFYNVYGPYQDTWNNGWETVISIFEKQLKANKPLTICGDGTQRRDFTYSQDIVNGLILASKKLENSEYQLGSGKDYSILEVAEMFGGEIQFVESRPGDRKKGLADVNKTKFELGWEAQMDLRTWIKSVL
tara:strand:- start:770 stop:1609 length:840 start_codon:yes stop_codon:yes gene_type:complete